MIKVLVIGPNGKMGKAIIHQAYYHPQIEVVGGVGPKGCRYSGVDLGVVAGIGENLGVVAADDINAVISNCHVVLECTTNDVAIELLPKCVEARKALVSGTTGFTADQKDLFAEAAKFIPVMHASNTSRLAHLYFRLIQWITNEIGSEVDIDIVEIHDRNKLDAPSGTSLEIGRIIAENLDQDFDEIARYQRKGKGGRPFGTIDYSSIRTGNFATSHKVIFGLENERLELSMDGYNMFPYAAGMIEAALFLYDKEPGIYTIEQAIN